MGSSLPSRPSHLLVLRDDLSNSTVALVADMLSACTAAWTRSLSHCDRSVGYVGRQWWPVEWTLVVVTARSLSHYCCLHVHICLVRRLCSRSCLYSSQTQLGVDNNTAYVPTYFPERTSLHTAVTTTTTTTTTSRSATATATATTAHLTVQPAAARRGSAEGGVHGGSQRAK